MWSDQSSRREKNWRSPHVLQSFTSLSFQLSRGGRTCTLGFAYLGLSYLALSDRERRENDTQDRSACQVVWFGGGTRVCLIWFDFQFLLYHTIGAAETSWHRWSSGEGKKKRNTRYERLNCHYGVRMQCNTSVFVERNIYSWSQFLLALQCLTLAAPILREDMRMQHWSTSIFRGKANVFNPQHKDECTCKKIALTWKVTTLSELNELSYLLKICFLENSYFLKGLRNARNRNDEASFVRSDSLSSPRTARSHSRGPSVTRAEERSTTEPNV
jgi:hypothetical protein